MARRENRKGTLLCLGFVLLLACTAAAQGQNNAQGPTLDELNKMEEQAQKARGLFWAGDFKQAAEIFEKLQQGRHVSSPLYLNELGSCYLAMGDCENAERTLAESAMLSEAFFDPKLEKHVLSAFGKEQEKIYRGDPYERAAVLMVLALLYLDKGDMDNAMAACKSGLLADSDASESMYESDFTMLYLLELACARKRGDPEQIKNIADQARKSYRESHASVRDVVSQRGDAQALLKMSVSERRKVGCNDKDEVLKTRVQTLDTQLAERGAAINPNRDIASLLSGEFNLLVMVPRGRSPVKARRGTDANIIVVEPSQAKGQPPIVLLDSAAMPVAAAPGLADIEFQALTRGGRKMDAILNGKVAYRSTTVGAGSTLTQIGNNVGGFAGLGVALLGAAIQGVGGAMSPEADARCWQCLPRTYEVYALKVPEGKHVVQCVNYAYFEAVNEFSRNVTITGDNDIKVVIVPPELAGIYAEHLN